MIRYHDGISDRVSYHKTDVGGGMGDHSNRPGRQTGRLAGWNIRKLFLDFLNLTKQTPFLGFLQNLYIIPSGKLSELPM